MLMQDMVLGAGLDSEMLFLCNHNDQITEGTNYPSTELE